MSDLLNTAVSGLLAAQRQLATTSHNISNISTPGYSRQRVELVTQNPQAINQISLGKGVVVSDIRRTYDEFVTTQVRDATSEYSRLSMFHQLAGVVDDMLADSGGGITPVLQRFFTAAQDVAGDPNSTAARIALIDQAGALTARFGYMDDRLSALQVDLTDRTGELIGEINELAKSIYETNQDLLAARGVSRSPPPDLLDRRDELLRQLSEKIGIQAVEQPTGAVNVFVGAGQLLVSEAEFNAVTATQNAADPSVMVVRIQSAGAAADITSSIGSGELAGVVDFRNGMIDDVRNGLGRLAVGIATLFNQQHRMGMDQNGTLGTDFFSVSGPQILPHNGNTGAATVTAANTDVSALTTDNYTAQFNGANWVLSRQDGTGSVTGAGPTLVLDGVTVTIGGGAPANGDSFVIKPTALAPGAFSVAVQRPELVAAASPVRSAASSANTGNANISRSTVLDATNANLLNPVTVRFNTPATTYDLVNTTTGAVLAAGQAYTSGANIDVNGWRIQIDGTPAPNDTFTVESNAGGVADNTNMLALVNLQNTGAFDGGNTNFQESYSSVVATVGSTTRFTEINLNAQDALKRTLVERRESVSGVNLDEEAADLVRYQQAYQAAARTISTAQELFQTLIAAFG